MRANALQSFEGYAEGVVWHSPGLPRSGYQPTQEPALEVFRAHPLEAGWTAFDIDCCVPVKPLAER